MKSSAARDARDPLHPACEPQNPCISVAFFGPALAAIPPEALAVFQPDTQFLIEQWTGMARSPGVRAGVPARADLEPERLAARLPRAFLLERHGDEAVFRLAGSWLESFHGESLKGTPFLDLWRTASRPLVAAGVAQTFREARPVAIVALAGSLEAPIEVLLTPLRGASAQPDLVLGLYAPAGGFIMPVDASRLLTARVTVGVGEPGRPALTLAAVGGRRVA